MSDDRRWLEDLVIVNSGADDQDIATVDVYRNMDEMLSAVDRGMVAAGIVAYTGGGGRVAIGLDDGNRVHLEGVEPAGDHGRGVVHAWLRKRAGDRLEARRREGLARGKREAEGVLPATVEGLIAYSGFTRA